MDIRFVNKVSTALRGADVAVVVAPKKALAGGFHRKALGSAWAKQLDRVVEDVEPGDNGACGSTYGGKNAPRRLVAVVLPNSVSRHNAPSRSEAILGTLPSAGVAGKKSAVVICLDDESHALPAAIAVARAFPTYSRKSGEKKKSRGKARMSVCFALRDGTPVSAPRDAKAAAEAVRLAARTVDVPPDDMTTAAFEKECRAAMRGVANVRVTSIVGQRLLAKGMGGIYGVGRCATVPPRLVVMDYNPRKRGGKTICLVGKGIVYDTGGLNIKVGAGMSNMKCDMGGAAAVLGAMSILTSLRVKHRVLGLVCLAENAIGPAAQRPDDIVEMHSGKTVELNNTDAEGRLVLADGVSYSARDLKADLIVDIATLTGAQLIATGRAIASTVSNRAGVEELLVECGRATGDLNHAMPFAPEYFHKQFKSKVADMKNSVADRMDASTCAAAQFVYNHIEALDVPWAHVDIAGPAFRGGRGTGFGGPLLAEMVRRLSPSDLDE